MKTCLTGTMWQAGIRLPSWRGRNGAGHVTALHSLLQIALRELPGERVQNWERGGSTSNASLGKQPRSWFRGWVCGLWGWLSKKRGQIAFLSFGQPGRSTAVSSGHRDDLHLHTHTHTIDSPVSVCVIMIVSIVYKDARRYPADVIQSP